MHIALCSIIVFVTDAQVKGALSVQVSTTSSGAEGTSREPSSVIIPAEAGEGQSSLVPSPSTFAMSKAELKWLQVPMVRSMLLTLMKNIVKHSATSEQNFPLSDSVDNFILASDVC